MKITIEAAGRRRKNVAFTSEATMKQKLKREGAHKASARQEDKRQREARAAIKREARLAKRQGLPVARH